MQYFKTIAVPRLDGGGGADGGELGDGAGGLRARQGGAPPPQLHPQRRRQDLNMKNKHQQKMSLVW